MQQSYNPTSINFRQNSPLDVSVQFMNSSSITIDNIKNGAYTLVEGVDFTRTNGYTVVLKKEFMLTLPKGVTSLVATMSNAATIELQVTLLYKYDGTGTSGDPFIVTSLAEFDAIRYGLNKSYRQAANLNFNTAPYNISPYFNPLGAFVGSYDGGNYTISNMTILKSGVSSVGIFNSLSVLCIMSNIKLSNISVTGGSNVGSLAGDSRATISNCYVSGISIYAGAYAGLLVGYMVGSSITDCHAQGIVHSTGAYAGGITGYAADVSVYIKNCTVDVTIESTGIYIGGIVGYQLSGIIEDCNAAVSISSTQGGLVYAGGICGACICTSQSAYTRIINCHASGNIVSSGSSVGGLVGSAGGSSGYYPITITKSSSSVSIVGLNLVGGLVGKLAYAQLSLSFSVGQVNGNDFVGGFIGSFDIAGASSVTNCYSTGKVSGGRSVGGFIGSIDIWNATYSTVSNCYAACEVIGGSSSAFVGGFDLSGAFVSSSTKRLTTTGCYFNSTLCPTNIPSCTTAPLGKTTLQMKTQATFTVFDFVDMWGMNGYPKLLANPEGDNYLIKGTVTLSGAAVNKAVISIVDSRYISAVTITGTDGKYRFEHLSPDRYYQLSVSYVDSNNGKFTAYSKAFVSPMQE